MESLNQVELQNIRHICGMIKTCCDKLEYYKTLSTDQNVVSVFENICTSAKALKTELCSMI